MVDQSECTTDMARSSLVEVRWDLASEEASSFFSSVNDHIKVFSFHDKEGPHHNDDPSKIPEPSYPILQWNEHSPLAHRITSLPVRYTVSILDVSLQDTEESLRRYNEEPRCMPLEASTFASSLRSHCKLYINLPLKRLLSGL